MRPRKRCCMMRPMSRAVVALLRSSGCAVRHVEALSSVYGLATVQSCHVILPCEA